MNRRQLLRSSAAAAIALPAIVPGRVFAAPGRPGANDRIRLGFIGLGGRAKWILTGEALPGAQVVAAADCYLPRCHEAAKSVPGAETWAKYQDYRKILEKEKLDAVFVETTTHARVLACLHVLQAGCDVYAEKPLSLTIAEGRVLADAVQKYDRVLQTGSQQRSMPINQYASKLVREGAIGKVHTVITFNFLPGMGWTPRAPQPIPEGLDWDMWCNQTELRPYNSELQFGWSKYIDYDTGGQSWGVTGWGTHSLDQVQCALGTDTTGPVEIWPEEDGLSSRVTARYASGTLLKLEGKKRGMEDLGAIFVGDHGKIEIKRGSFTADPAELLKGAPPETKQGRGESIAHIRNFFDCIRTRNRPNADVETGHRATSLCHLVNICRIMGRKLYWDPQGETFVGDDQANLLLSRPRRKGYELPQIG
jgi:predicted dehydrogenase